MPAKRIDRLREALANHVSPPDEDIQPDDLREALEAGRDSTAPQVETPDIQKVNPPAFQSSGLSSTQNPETSEGQRVGRLDAPLSETPVVWKPDPLERQPNGRPPGKRSNADYAQINAYIPEDLRRAVKKAVIDLPKKRSPKTGRLVETEISDVIEALLRDWVAGRIEIQIGAEVEG